MGNSTTATITGSRSETFEANVADSCLDKDDDVQVFPDEKQRLRFQAQYSTACVSGDTEFNVLVNAFVYSDNFAKQQFTKPTRLEMRNLYPKVARAFANSGNFGQCQRLTLCRVR
jgi:hypothetical protein